MTINNQEILGMLESPDRSRELSAGIQCRQDQIKYIMEQENLSQTKDLITIVQNFKGLTNLDENDLKTKYNILKIEELKRTYPDFELSLEDGDIHAVLRSYKGKTLPEFPAGMKELNIWDCPNLESLPKLPPGLKKFYVVGCKNLEAIPEFPSGIEYLQIKFCPNLGSIPEFPSGLESLAIYNCPKINQETRDRIENYKCKKMIISI